MTTCFDRWEKDPFFLAAEEVQESTDRMESVFRRWIHERKGGPNPKNGTVDVSAELLRELQTALGTAKWQLEELDRAVRSNDDACSAGEETRTRHSEFVDVIGSQISTVENSLKESRYEKGESKHSWVQLDEGERDELALFLSHEKPPLPDGGSKSGLRSNQLPKRETKEQKLDGYRRTASAADMESWKILVPSEDHLPKAQLPKMPSLSSLTAEFEFNSKVNWSKNIFRKLKGGDQQDDPGSIPLRNHELSRGCNDCYERTKSCLSSCGHETYDKQLYGWFGALQRQLQRSQYQIQYGRPIQLIFWAILVVLLIVLVAMRAI